MKNRAVRNQYLLDERIADQVQRIGVIIDDHAHPPRFTVTRTLPRYYLHMSLLRERTRPPDWGLSNRVSRHPAKARPSGPGEIKHGGFRILARRDSSGVRLAIKCPPSFRFDSAPGRKQLGPNCVRQEIRACNG